MIDYGKMLSKSNQSNTPSISGNRFFHEAVALWLIGMPDGGTSFDGAYQIRAASAAVIAAACFKAKAGIREYVQSKKTFDAQGIGIIFNDKKQITEYLIKNPEFSEVDLEDVIKLIDNPHELFTKLPIANISMNQAYAETMTCIGYILQKLQTLTPVTAFETIDENTVEKEGKKYLKTLFKNGRFFKVGEGGFFVEDKIFFDYVKNDIVMDDWKTASDNIKSFTKQSTGKIKLKVDIHALANLLAHN